MWLCPLLMTANRTPSGGDAWPAVSLPQQSGVPSNSNPHVWLSPLLTDSTWSVGTGIDCPWSSLPQQTGGPVGDTRQVCRPPLLMNDGNWVTNGTSGCGVSIPGSSRGWSVCWLRHRCGRSGCFRHRSGGRLRHGRGGRSRCGRRGGSAGPFGSCAWLEFHESRLLFAARAEREKQQGCNEKGVCEVDVEGAHRSPRMTR